MIYKREKSRCSACPLYSEHRLPVWGEGPEGEVDLVILGDHPSQADHETGRVFSDKAGSYISWACHTIGAHRPSIWHTNVMSCFSTPESIGFTEGLKCCIDGLQAELDWLQEEKKAKAILVMGEIPLKVLGHSESLEKFRGSIIQEDDGLLLIPTWHTRDLARKTHTWKGDKGAMDANGIWKADFRKAYDVAVNGWKPPVENFLLNPTVDQVERTLRRYIDNQVLTGCDIETTGFGVNSRLVMIGLAESDEKGICIPFLKHKDEGDKGAPYWSLSDERRVKSIVQEWLLSAPSMWHNALFDIRYLSNHGWEVNWDMVKHDTMLLNHAISPELKHDLGFVTSIYGRTPYWKQEFKKKKGTILDMNSINARTYNLRDSVVLHQILPDMLLDVEEVGNTDTYYNESLALLPSFAEMMNTGLVIDEKDALNWRKYITNKVKTSERDIHKKYNLPDSFNIKSSQHLMYFLFNYPLPQFEKLSELEDFEEKDWRAWRCEACNRKVWFEVGQEKHPICSKCGSKTYIPQDEYKTSPKRKKGTQAHKHLLELKELHEGGKPIYIPSYFPKVSRKTKLPMVDEKGRLAYKTFLNKRRSDIERFKRPRESHIKELSLIATMLEFLEDYNLFAKYEKLRSTYGTFKVVEGRVQQSVRIHGTGTGRIAGGADKDRKTDEINPLTMPAKPEKFDKNDPMFSTIQRFAKIWTVPTPAQAVSWGWIDTEENWYILSADYSSLEALTMAYETMDPELIKAVEGGKLHDVNTTALFGLQKGDVGWKLHRNLAKIFMFAHISYGGSLRETYANMKATAPDMTLTLAGLEEAAQRYWETMPVFADWRENVQSIALKDRVSVNAFGRVRRLFGSDADIMKQALNNPNQSAAAYIMNRATIRAHKRVRELGLKSRLMLQIYDDMRWYFPESEREILLPLVVEEMEKPVVMHGVERVFPTDVEVGTTWGNLKPVSRETWR